jgi:flagellar biosynthesis protein FlhG
MSEEPSNSVPGESPPSGGIASKGAPRIISIGGGPGGAGKSLLAVNLAVYLAQLGRSVVLADVDPAGAGLHTMLGLDSQEKPVKYDAEGRKSQPIPTSIPGLVLLPPVHEPGGPLLRSGKKAGWLANPRELPADYVLLDLGAGIAPAALDLFAWSDVSLVVTTPEPPAIESTYRFLRALFVRQVARSLGKESHTLRIVERILQELPALPSPIAIVEALDRCDGATAALARTQLSLLRPRLVVSKIRLRSDLDLGPAMRTLAGRYLGVLLDYLGYIEHDDSVWLTVRRRRPLLIDNPACKGARNVERIARRVVALATAREGRALEEPLSASSDMLTLYDALGVPRGASDEEIRRASKRQREIFAEGSLPLTSLIFGAELAREQARIEEAHDTLLDPVRRRAYDLSTFPESAPVSPPQRGPTSHEATSEHLILEAELAREIHGETQFTGALLRKVREAQGVEIAEIAARTKIATAHLLAIEQDGFEALPALVYTRGFVQELAKFLHLDAAQVAKTYLKRMREALARSGRDAF